MKKIVAVSGGFDPVHVGHIRMFNEAKKLGDYLVVIMNNDNWLKMKKGFVFMPENERREVLESLSSVDEVIVTKHQPRDPDISVCRELLEIRPHVFANGGDRKADNIPELILCKELGIETAFNVGFGGKIQSSSALAGQLVERRPWGFFHQISHEGYFWLKKLVINPGSRLSLQSHQLRDEVWVVVEGSADVVVGDEEKLLKQGEMIYIPRGHKHRLGSLEGAVVIEVAHGLCREDDIVRFSDDYGRANDRYNFLT
jgi:D-beta-D-heptose 7-phosphate kinase/D-beta-D-heptose 1-phosphate adenosyltransferase